MTKVDFSIRGWEPAQSVYYYFFVAEKGEPRAEIQQHFGFLVEILPPAEETGRSTSCLTRYLPYRKTVRIKPGF